MSECKLHIRAVYGPKMDWHGMGYRYECECGKIGTWRDTPFQAENNGNTHVKAKEENAARQQGAKKEEGSTTRMGGER